MKRLIAQSNGPRISFSNAPLRPFFPQVPCSLSEPKVYEVVEDQVRRVEELFRPDTYFLSHDEIRVACWSEPERQSGRTAGQDWTEHHVVFNSLDNDEVRFYLGVWDCGGGKLWIDDVRLVEEPLVNLVRRPGCPLLVQDANGQTI